MKTTICAGDLVAWTCRPRHAKRFACSGTVLVLLSKKFGGKKMKSAKIRVKTAAYKKAKKTTTTIVAIKNLKRA